MQFSTRRTSVYTLLLFITFDAWNTTIHLSEIRYSAYFASHRDIFQTQPLQKGLLSLVLHIGHLSIRNIAMIYLLEWAPNNSFPMPKATFIELAIFSTQLLNFCLCLSDHWSRQKKLLWGWEVATDRPPPLALSSIMLREKRESHL